MIIFASRYMDVGIKKYSVYSRFSNSEHFKESTEQSWLCRVRKYCWRWVRKDLESCTADESYPDSALH